MSWLTRDWQEIYIKSVPQEIFSMICAGNLLKTVLKISAAGDCRKVWAEERLDLWILMYKRQKNGVTPTGSSGAKITVVLSWSKGTRTFYAPSPAPYWAPPHRHIAGVMSLGKAAIFSLTIYGQGLRSGPLAANTSSIRKRSISVLKVRSRWSTPVSITKSKNK